MHPGAEQAECAARFILRREQDVATGLAGGSRYQQLNGVEFALLHLHFGAVCRLPCVAAQYCLMIESDNQAVVPYADESKTPALRCLYDAVVHVYPPFGILMRW